MVRYGEYSPLNPDCRTSSKLLLGIGEYDERKRLLEEKRKQAYKQQIRAGRKECSLLGIPENYVAPVTSNFCSKFADKSVQVDSGTSNEQNKIHRTCVDQCVQVTELPEVNISEDLLKAEYGIPDKFDLNRKYVRGLHHLEGATDEKLHVDIEDSSVKNPIDFSLLSPRERRLLEFCGSGSYNPSFYEKLKSPTRTVAEKDTDSAREHIDSQVAEQLRKRTYQDELRKQIEEKRRLEAEQKEKERREEEIIMKRVEQQQLKMKLEFEREQAQRRSKVDKRMHEFDSCKSRNEPDNCGLKSSGSNSENRTKSESSLSTKIENIKHLPQGVKDKEFFSSKSDMPYTTTVDRGNGNYLSVLDVCQTRDLSKNTIDDLMYNQNERPGRTERNTEPGGTVIDTTQVPDNLPWYQRSRRGFSESSAQDSCEPSSTKSSCNIEIPSLLKKDTGIAHRKRPVPTPRTRLLSDSVRTVLNSESEVPSGHNQNHSTVVLTEKETPVLIEKQNLEDSLPIPILKETKCVEYDSNETPDTEKVKSAALWRTEAKWQIPAVQKNLIHIGSSCGDKHHGRILTQLGAIRKQLQLDQLRKEAQVKNIKTQSDA